MFETFLSKFKLDDYSEKEKSLYKATIQAEGLEGFMQNFSGCSFNNGLYRIHSAGKIEYWNRLLGEAFPNLASRIYCFGYDWLGRQFTLDKCRVSSNEPLVLMLEPGTGEALEIPANFLQFHEQELVNFSNEALAVDFYNEWLMASNQPPSLNQSISYKKPLYLGGSDTIDNLEIMDLEVYWELSSQMLNKIRGLATGTKIDNVSMS